MLQVGIGKTSANSSKKNQSQDQSSRMLGIVLTLQHFVTLYVLVIWFFCTAGIQKSWIRIELFLSPFLQLEISVKTELVVPSKWIPDLSKNFNWKKFNPWFNFSVIFTYDNNEKMSFIGGMHCCLQIFIICLHISIQLWIHCVKEVFIPLEKST